MGISLKGLKVIYKEQVLNAVALLEFMYADDVEPDTTGYADEALADAKEIERL